MFVYNVTNSVDKGIAAEWLDWMKNSHIPSALKTGLFFDCRILQVLTHDDDQTYSFAVQYHSKSIAQIEQFFKNEPEQPFSDRVVPYPTLLEQVYPGS